MFSHRRRAANICFFFKKKKSFVPTPLLKVSLLASPKNANCCSLPLSASNGNGQLLCVDCILLTF